MSGIGTLGEGPLHAALKEWIAGPRDRMEVELSGFVIDLVRDGELVEIQTRGFSSLRRKLDALLDHHPIRIVHPIAVARWIRRVDANGVERSRRRSPIRGRAVDVCDELVSFPTLLDHPNLTVELLLIHEEEIRRPDPSAWRRRGWRVEARHLLDVVDRVVLASPRDLLAFLPGELPDPFTTADLATALETDPTQARAVAYCLRECGVLETEGRTREGWLYRVPRHRGTRSARRPTSAPHRA